MSKKKSPTLGITKDEIERIASYKSVLAVFKEKAVVNPLYEPYCSKFNLIVKVSAREVQDDWEGVIWQAPECYIQFSKYLKETHVTFCYDIAKDPYDKDHQSCHPNTEYGIPCAGEEYMNAWKNGTWEEKVVAAIRFLSTCNTYDRASESWKETWVKKEA